jgi:transcriptional regulatory protein RtcR
MDKVVFGFLGTTLERRLWRSSLGKMASHDCAMPAEDVLIHRLVLFHGGGHNSLLRLITADIQRISPETVVEPVHLSVRDPWDFVEGVFGAT